MKVITNWAKLFFAAMLAFCVSTTARAEWVEDEDLISNPSQLSSNCQWDNYAVDAMLDGDHNTYFHSDVGKNLFNTDEWLQVDLDRNDVSKIIIEYWGRNDGASAGLEYHDNPTKIVITATNTPDDESSWVEITTLDKGFPDNIQNAHYTSPMIDLGAAYRYLRLHVQNTSSGMSYWNLSEFQVYTAVELNDNRISLQNLIDSIYGLNLNIETYDQLGYFSGEAVEAYNGKLTECLDLIDDKSATQENLATAIGELRGTVAALKASVITPGDGNWFIYSADSAFIQTRAMYAGNGQLRWGVLDSNVPMFYFNIKKLDDGNYIVRNLYDGSYIGWGTGEVRSGVSTSVTTIDADTVEQQLTPAYDGTFYISNTMNPAPNYYNAQWRYWGVGKDGPVSPLAGIDVSSQWRFVPADTTGLAQKAAAYPARMKADKLAEAIDGLEFVALEMEMKAPATGLVKTASQLSSNCAWGGSADYNQLIDGNHNTHFHSSPIGMSIYGNDEWLQIDLGSNDVSKLIIDFYGRDDAPNFHDTPNAFTITATNTPGNDASWVEITGFFSDSIANERNAHYVSPVVNMGAAYRYVRLHVRSTTSGYPYWNISELQLYNAENIEASENSYYSKNATIKAAVDALDSAIATADAHIAAKTVDGTELEPIENSIDKIKATVAEISGVQALIDEANFLADNIYRVDVEKSLITEVNTRNSGNQLSSNCTWTGISEDNDNYPLNASFIQDNYNLLGTLIDNDDQTYWHSDPTGFNVNTQNGFFQIDLKRDDVSSYRFMLWRRNDLYNGANRHGQMPKSLDIYATNDASVGTSLESENSAWTSLGTISNIPDENTDGVWPYYTAAVGDGTAYRYLRVRFYNSSAAFIGLSGFNVYDSNDMYSETKSQYLVVDGMKAAADRMQSLATLAQAKVSDKNATAADGEELEAAIAAVRALYQDHDALSALIARAQAVAGNTVVGEEMGQLRDESALNTLNDEAIPDAQEAAANIIPSTAEFNTIVDNLQKAIDNIYDNIVQPVPGKWYYILSATAEGDASPADGYYGVARDEVRGTALYVLSNGGVEGKGDKEGEYIINQLRWGMDDIKGKARKGDVDAIWRFIAAPDSFGKRAYYIQNLRTGYYVGGCHTESNDYFLLPSDSTYVPYRLDYIGDESFNLVPLAGARAGVPISFGDNARQIRGNDIAQTPGNRASLTFEEFDTDDNPNINIDFFNDSARIVTLPFAVSSLGRNAGVRAYSIHSVVKNDEGQGIGIGLTQKDEFAAGEPFILVVGDTTKHTAESGYKTLTFTTPAPDAMLTPLVADTVNGLIGTFPRTVCRTSKDHDYLFLRGTSLRINSPAFLDTTKYTGNTIYAHTGYIDPVRIVDQEGEPDVVMYTPQGTFRTEVVNAINKIAVDSNNGKVNVYTIDGALVKKNVSIADAVKGLKKGLYIIGKEKVLVK